MSDGFGPERVSGLALIPVASTGLYYLLPLQLQEAPAVQFLPQVLAYLSLALWASRNTDVMERLGIRRSRILEGVQWGVPIGLALGGLNVSVMLWLIPWFGYDIEFLRHTPHARLPVALMLPWFILVIAAGVELNFRGFVLGRLLTLIRQSWAPRHALAGPTLAVGLVSLVFSFDPFMVATFQHLHWIALWDGIIWGMIWLRTGNLSATIIAHAVEVIVMYSILKLVLS